MRLRFLGTGASGGTPGRGRSRRQESSLLVDRRIRVLLDVTRDFSAQVEEVERIDALLLTNAHRDAAGGLGALRRWCRDRGTGPIPVYSHPRTLAAIASHYARLDYCRFRPVEALKLLSFDGFAVAGLELPHALDPRYPTFAWRLAAGGRAFVYASDVAKLTPELERFSRGVDLLVLDGAMWGRSLFSHLRGEQALPIVCQWNVKRIVLTQIGRTAPPHERLEGQVGALCSRARPAYDGLELRLSDSAVKSVAPA